jgi:hypothetical protein
MANPKSAINQQLNDLYLTLSRQGVNGHICPFRLFYNYNFQEGALQFQDSLLR